MIPVSALIPSKSCIPSWEASNTNSIVFGLIQPRLSHDLLLLLYISGRPSLLKIIGRAPY
jgi:hypothetical protein